MNYPPITAALLEAKKACEPQIDLIRKTFGEGEIDVSDENAIKYAKVFDFSWAARNLLTNGDIDEYLKVIAPAWAEYVKVRAPALAEYSKVRDIAWAEYLKVRDLAWDEYKKVHDLAYAEYKKVIALAFVHLYRKGMNKNNT